MIMKYIIITGSGNLLIDFNKHIEQKLKEGYKLQGGVSAVSQFGDIMLYQALIKD